MTKQSLPRLLYLGDVPVDSTLAGSALLYRLLEEYPKDSLTIFEANISQSALENRLPGVTYQTIQIGSRRLLNSRLSSVYNSYLLLRAKLNLSSLHRSVKLFCPEAILTVAHGFSWLAAAALAQRFNLPLHLVIHDDWTSYIPVIPALKSRANHQFGRIYHQASSRLCVSPYMMASYLKRYGVEGEILYPSRAKDIPKFDHPPKLTDPSQTLCFAYAGSIATPAYAESLRLLAIALESFGCNLLIYSPLTEDQIAQFGLRRSNVITHPVIPSQQLIYTLRKAANVLFVPMSFEPEHRPNMEMSFPSKLTDYTAIGLPLFIWGPPYCSAVRWAQENPDAAEVVTEKTLEALTPGLKKLIQDPEHRYYLGKAALEKGQKYFSYEASKKKFYQAILQGATPP